MSLLTEKQREVIEWIPYFNSPLSIVGSSCLIYLVSSKLNASYNRFILSLSVVDIVASLWTVVGFVPVPDDLPYSPSGARGNTATCTTQGFFLFFGFRTTLFYNVSLMIYFYAIICKGVTPEKFAKRAEPVLHVLSIMIPLIMGAVGLAMEIFNYTGGRVCQISPHPLGCDQIPGYPCIRGEKATPFANATVVASGYICMVIFALCLFRVYWQFRSISKRAMRYTMTASTMKTQQQMSVQCILYGVVFFNTFVWSTIISTLVAAGKLQEFDFFPILLLSNIFYPFQGFFNFLVYIRPKYARLRTSNPTQGRWWAFCQIFRKTDALNNRSTFHRQTTTAGSQLPSSTFIGNEANPNTEKQLSFEACSSSSLMPSTENEASPNSEKQVAFEVNSKEQPTTSTAMDVEAPLTPHETSGGTTGSQMPSTENEASPNSEKQVSFEVISEEQPTTSTAMDLEAPLTPHETSGGAMDVNVPPST